MNQRYQIPMELLKEYEERDLQKKSACDQAKAYDDGDLLWLSRWLTLQEAGFLKEERTRYIGLWEKEEKEQRLAMLEEKRHALLEEIHKKEEQLNHLDYLRHETRQESRR